MSQSISYNDNSSPKNFIQEAERLKELLTLSLIMAPQFYALSSSRGEIDPGHWIKSIAHLNEDLESNLLNEFTKHGKSLALSGRRILKQFYRQVGVFHQPVQSDCDAYNFASTVCAPSVGATMIDVSLAPEPSAYTAFVSRLFANDLRNEMKRQEIPLTVVLSRPIVAMLLPTTLSPDASSLLLSRHGPELQRHHLDTLETLVSFIDAIETATHPHGNTHVLERKMKDANIVRRNLVFAFEDAPYLRQTRQADIAAIR